MWVFTRHGFFSVTASEVDPSKVKLRARDRFHLEQLQAAYPELLGGLAIDDQTGTDYAVRIFVDRSRWAQVAARLAEDIDYSNFKNAAHAHASRHWPQTTAKRYLAALHEIWSVTRRWLQGESSDRW